MDREKTRSFYYALREVRWLYPVSDAFLQAVQVQTQMYVEGFKAKLEKDTSYKGLWTVSFTLKEF
jgi:hypothetical protein